MYEGKITKSLKREFCSVAECMRECEKKLSLIQNGRVDKGAKKARNQCIMKAGSLVLIVCWHFTAGRQ